MTSREIKKHAFPNGDLLHVEAVDSYYGLMGLTVYSVVYAELDNGNFNAMGSEHFMTEPEALAAFDLRVESAEPWKPSRQHGGIHEIVVDAFQRYAGQGVFSASLPTDWGALFNHVKDTTLSRDNTFYNGEAAHVALDGLTTVAADASEGRSDVLVTLPAWKILEMHVAITALAAALQLHTKPKISVAA